MKTVIIVQARMTSTRLPGKVLKTVLGKPLLEYQLERLQRVSLADQIVIATTVNETDQPIVDLCDRLSIPTYRGSEEDVLARYYEAATQFAAEVIVRVTSDCPLIDPELIDRVIAIYQQNAPNLDYIVTDEVSYPRGMDVEVFSMRVLEGTYKEATHPTHREHVTPFIYQQPSRYHIYTVIQDCLLAPYRLTVDTSEDFELIRCILEHLYSAKPQFNLHSIIDLLQQKPELVAINAHVRQKPLMETVV
ncbi:glycosyltransferase family protein [Alkalinema sp. FACHB-956]|uniref:cytidylyltransferase domain-containing protein n=1 Tax=Alkalinema sp. FACHB-956 TaxID=2692768 RepID=UPI001683891E|nr:glycosyltransferase family protein [Alkalinema sp. FACHB-956]MBD2327196.1 glycosyltransferase family protein [Alkalinema sp. FACHB-956]